MPPVKLLQIPEETLEELLAKAGIQQSPEEFLAGIQDTLQAGKNYQKRAGAAYWSTIWLGISAGFSLISFLLDHNLEDGISTALLGTMTYTESQVRIWFLKADPRAAVYGYWNQCLFAALFLIYGGYHYFTVTVPPEVTQAVGSQLDGVFLQTAKLSYAAIGIVGGACQYLLALYYRRSTHPTKKWTPAKKTHKTKR